MSKPTPDESEVAWAAGFFDGEGNTSHHRTAMQVMVAQVGVEPLERFRLAVGGLGVVYLRHEARGNEQAAHGWRVWRQADVETVLGLLWPYLCSPKRLQATRQRALAGMNRSFWRPGRHPNHSRHNRLKTHCPQGHPYDDANTVRSLTPSGGPRRSCRECSLRRHREWAHRRKERGSGVPNRVHVR